MVAESQGCGACFTTYHGTASCPRVWVAVAQSLSSRTDFTIDMQQALEGAALEQVIPCFAHITAWPHIVEEARRLRTVD